MYLFVEIASSNNSFYYCYVYFHSLFVKNCRLHIEEEVFVPTFQPMDYLSLMIFFLNNSMIHKKIGVEKQKL